MPEPGSVDGGERRWAAMNCCHTCWPSGGAEGVPWKAGEVVAVQRVIVRPPVVWPGGVAGVGHLLVVCGGLEGVPAQVKGVLGGWYRGKQAVRP